MAQAQVRANGTINTASFVKIDPTTNNGVIQASAPTDKLFGVSQNFANAAPIPGASVTTAAVAGEPVLVYQPGDNCICLLTAGTAGWTAGDLLMAADVNGYGYTCTAGNFYCARALATVAAGGLGTVEVVFGQL